jgi:hypothetical protein
VSFFTERVLGFKQKVRNGFVQKRHAEKRHAASKGAGRMDLSSLGFCGFVIYDFFLNFATLSASAGAKRSERRRRRRQAG